MRFIENGPSIPEELLLARDEGRVIFFCGAGVSCAKAKLPSFLQLAKNVISHLGITKNSPAQQLFDYLNSEQLPSNISNLISADRVFSFLEQEFDINLIEKVVAQELKSNDNVDLSAHKILLDLATTSDKRTQLVTTNFDCLFDLCYKKKRPYWIAPELPILSKENNLNGIVYLHGKVNSNHSGSEKGQFILSGSQFGKAYLADGWATSFIKNIFEKYIIVFVGYSANDPPIQYLLEGLAKTNIKLNKIFAFQAGTNEDARKQWQPKGVHPIAYENDDHTHKQLWNTLNAWAKRAKNIDLWYDSVLRIARCSPHKLKPYQRGQVVHVASTVIGAKKFALSVPPIPAEWLYVFDPICRLSSQSPYNYILQKKDPELFSLYSLDSDIKELESNKKNNDSLDVFAINQYELSELNKRHFANFRTPYMTQGFSIAQLNAALLSQRQTLLAQWLASVSDQSATITWALKQKYLAPTIEGLIQNKIKTTENIKLFNTWQMIFEYWNNENNRSITYWYELVKEISLYGWNHTRARKYIHLSKPYITVNSYDNSIAPSNDGDINLDSLCYLDVHYISPTYLNEIIIPNNWLNYITLELRKNIEHAYQLEREKYDEKDPIRLASPISLENDYDSNNLTQYVYFYLSLLLRLADYDLTLVKKECLCWPTDNPLFTQLSIWLARNKKIMTSVEVITLLSQLCDECFWVSDNEIDLILTITERWEELNNHEQLTIINRILKGPNNIKIAEFNIVEYKAYYALNKIHLLKQNIKNWPIDIDTEIDILKLQSPTWEKDNLRYNIANETKAEIEISIDKLINKITNQEVDLNIQWKLTQQFGKKSQSIFIALNSFYQQNNKFPTKVWSLFLYDEQRKNDAKELVKDIANFVLTTDKKCLIDIINPLLYWLNTIHFKLDIPLVDLILTKVIKILAISKSNLTKANIKSPQRDWLTEALNSPIAILIEILFSKNRIDKNRYIDFDNLFKQLNHLNTLTGDLRKYLLIYFGTYINYFYKHNLGWANNKILPILKNNDIETQILLFGYCYGGAIPYNINLFNTLKPYLLKYQSTEKELHQQLRSRKLANFLLFGWSSLSFKRKKQYITDQEFRNILIEADEEFRNQIILCLKLNLENDRNINWKSLIINFFINVWPNQKTIKSPKITSLICNRLLLNIELFLELTPIVLPFLTKTSDDYYLLHSIDDFLKKSELKNEQLKEEYIRNMVELLHVILPAPLDLFSYKIREILSTLENLDNSIIKNKKFQKLKQTWFFD